jgi:polyphosphate kinase 2 (PPK2 family)
MGFATRDQHERFLALCPEIEKHIVDAGIILIKIWLEVGKEEQERRFLKRVDDPLRQWKLSPMDLESYKRWYEYSKARDLMLEATDSKHSPWAIVHSDDKRRGRLNCISHILAQIPYKKISRDKVRLPKRSKKHAYDDSSPLKKHHFVKNVYQ